MNLIRRRVGVDVGSVFVKLVVLDELDGIVHRVARRHHGNPVAVVRAEMLKLSLDGQVAVGVTGANSHLIAGGMNLLPVDFVNSEIHAVRRVFPDARNIVDVGGSSVTLIQLDGKGNFIDYSTNSLCAAGTGSFLDQQADRLGIKYDDLKDMAYNDLPPPIATRCSVFAKSDLIHRQQEGYSKASLWCGLCKSMTSTFLNTLLRGRPLKGLTVITGGVAQNREVLRWLKARYGDLVQTFEDAPFSCAVGAAIMTNGHVDNMQSTILSLREADLQATEAPRRSALKFQKTRYPSFDVDEEYVDAKGNEVRVTHWPSGKTMSVYLGIDVGSTSTKVLLMDSDERVVADVYRRTAGDPIQAAKQLFAAIQDLSRRKGSSLNILGVGSTGSGRKLAGQVIGADLVVNEITAHLTGAMHIDPTVDTIFEIGGQDSKYIHARNGRIFDSNMNYVCAAGTGSFVEEQAKKLGVALEEIGDIVMGVAPPVTSDRCTVFMEQDVDRLIRQGYTPVECMAAVLCSVVKNYSHKVVGRRHVSRTKIFFQGATARNKGLVAAFENLLDVEMVVSPYCHVMGSYGAALLAKRSAGKSNRPTQFRGLGLAQRRIALHSNRCELCQNNCKITFAEIEGQKERPSWGYMCGRDPDSAQMRVHREFAPVRKRLQLLFSEKGEAPPTATRTVGIPTSLTAYSLYPLWRRFFRELGFKVALSDRTDEEIVRLGNELTAADFCFPIKVAHGHAARLALDKTMDFIFLPFMISSQRNPKTSNSFFCPYVQSFPSAVRSALTLHGEDASRFLMPVVDFSLAPALALNELERGLARPLKVTRAQIKQAWRLAREEQCAFEKQRREEGLRVLRELESRNDSAIVLIGRPYNTLDFGANLALPQKIADLGVTVIPMDMLPYDIENINPAFSNMYWSYGQHILAAAEFIRNHPNLYGIYFSNFSCGPDSFLLSFVEEIMGEKPLLMLELDEHGGDAGYMTRVEAFMDVLRSWTPREQPPFSIPQAQATLCASELRKRKLWLPNMHSVGGPLYAAAFRSEGYRAQPLPPESYDTFGLGRALTRGSECLPTACTTGTFVNILRAQESKEDEHAVFMPSSDGPCRFGQYALLQRIVLNRLGYANVPILSPSCGNSYQGLNQRLRKRFWQAILCSDFLLKAVLKARPYETESGVTDAVAQEEIARIVPVLEKGGDINPAFEKAIRRIATIPTRGMGERPLVGVVGEIYVRCNPFGNDNVIRAIERFGGEAWLAPISEWVLYVTHAQRWKALQRPLYLPNIISAYLKNKFVKKFEHKFQRLATPFLDDRVEPEMEDIVKEGMRFLPMNFQGEAIITLGRAVLFALQGASLVVNVAPFGCMPGTITSALCREVQAQTNVPMISLFYDGEPGMSQRLEVFLAGLTARRPQGVGGCV